MSAKERGALQALKEALKPCDLNTCHNERCEVDKQGVHQEISWNQLRVWAEALAAGTYGITYRVPPNSKHFEEFHGNTANAVANAGTTEPTRIRSWGRWQVTWRLITTGPIQLWASSRHHTFHFITHMRHNMATTTRCR
ncbi:hypothetical protein JB92DRAFT_2829133 [Gautieria morchelliformis]|nr:hypothetical protein JB92DRAFT_2829133 [Gautieria morchelliformis]